MNRNELISDIEVFCNRIETECGKENWNGYECERKVISIFIEIRNCLISTTRFKSFAFRRRALAGSLKDVK
jgi:hypothetical protein